MTAAESVDPADSERGPNRRCIVTRAIAEKSTLLRFVVNPDNQLMVDFAGNLPGRGMWLTPTRSVLDQALSQRAFAKAARAPVVVPDDLEAKLYDGLRRRLLDQLGLAKRAGLVALGFDVVLSTLLSEDGGKNYRGLLIAASDAAENGRDKLRQKARSAERLDLFDTSTLSQTLGRPLVIHAAIADRGFTARISALRDRLIALFPSAGSAKPDQYSEEVAS